MSRNKVFILKVSRLSSRIQVRVYWEISLFTLISLFYLKILNILKINFWTINAYSLFNVPLDYFISINCYRIQPITYKLNDNRYNTETFQLLFGPALFCTQILLEKQYPSWCPQNARKIAPMFMFASKNIL